jgi:hypothetical protein
MISSHLPIFSGNANVVPPLTAEVVQPDSEVQDSTPELTENEDAAPRGHLCLLTNSTGSGLGKRTLATAAASLQALCAEIAAELQISVECSQLRLEMWSDDFEEYVDIKQMSELPAKCKVRVSLRADLKGAGAGLEPQAGPQDPDPAAKAKTKPDPTKPAAGAQPGSPPAAPQPRPPAVPVLPLLERAVQDLLACCHAAFPAAGLQNPVAAEKLRTEGMR